MMTMMVVNMREPYLQKTGILLNSKGHVTSVEGMVIKVQTVMMMGRVSFQKMPLVGFVPRKYIGFFTVESLKRQELNLTELI